MSPAQPSSPSRLLRRLRPLACLLLLSLGAVASRGQGLAPAWTFPSDPFGAGREVLAVSTFVVGTDGSVAFALTVHDGSFSNVEYKLFWLSAAGDLLWSSEFDAEALQPLALRRGLLAYLEGGNRLHQVVGTPGGSFVETTVGTLGSSDTAYAIEQGRSPGFLYIAETATDKSGFTVHAYRIDPGTTADLAPMFAGVSGDGFVLYFPSVSGELYQVEESSDLVNWLPVGSPLPGTGSLQSHTDPSLSGAAYYRVRKL